MDTCPEVPLSSFYCTSRLRNDSGILTIVAATRRKVTNYTENRLVLRQLEQPKRLKVEEIKVANPGFIGIVH